MSGAGSECRSFFVPAQSGIPVGLSTIGIPLLMRTGSKLDHAVVMRRQVTHRIGRPRVAGDGKGLTAAAAEIDVAPLAARARLRQPVGAAERVEGRRVLPDLGQRMIAHVPEF